LQVDTPKASMQRRVYAAGEGVPEQAAAVPPGQPRGLPQRPTTTTQQPGAPQRRVQRSDSNRVDPAQIPHQDAQADAGRPWLTRTNLGEVPPPAASGFLVEDDGNASPRYMRLSLNQLVASEDHLKASAMPFGVVVQPLPKLVPSVVFA
jgi:protein transport protein SEC24